MYCKLLREKENEQLIEVLIVAKCIVNILRAGDLVKIEKVLIVAKCIVNFINE